MNEATRVTTGLVRLSYANLFKPMSIAGSKPKYSVSVIIPKKDKATIEAVKKAIEAAKEEFMEKYGKKAAQDPKFRNPLLDGDKKGDEAYKESYYINAKSDLKPKIFNRSGEEIVEEAEVYSGCYGRVSINFYGYNNAGKGISAGLRGVKKYQDGEPLGGSANVRDDFDDDFDDEDDDFLA